MHLNISPTTSPLTCILSSILRTSLILKVFRSLKLLFTRNTSCRKSPPVEALRANFLEQRMQKYLYMISKLNQSEILPCHQGSWRLEDNYLSKYCQPRGAVLNAAMKRAERAKNNTKPGKLFVLA